jgi:hypothetical protein
MHDSRIPVTCIEAASVHRSVKPAFYFEREECLHVLGVRINAYMSLVAIGVMP